MDTRSNRRVLLQVSHAPAEAPKPMLQGVNFTVTICDTHIPAFISEGKLYIQAPLGLVWKAIAKNISEGLRDLEVGISVEGRAPLSLDSVGDPVSGSPMAGEGVVRSG